MSKSIVIGLFKRLPVQDVCSNKSIYVGLLIWKVYYVGLTVS